VQELIGIENDMSVVDLVSMRTAVSTQDIEDMLEQVKKP